MPNTGPSDGSRRASIVSMPMAFIDSAKPIEVTVLPSPSGVGVIAVTSMILPSGLSLRRSSTSHVVDLGLVPAVELELVVEDARLLGDRLDGLHGRSLGDLDVGWYGGLTHDLAARGQRVLLQSTARAFGCRDSIGAARGGSMDPETGGTRTPCRQEGFLLSGWMNRRPAARGGAGLRALQEPLKRLRAAAWAASYTTLTGRPTAAATARTSSNSGDTVTRRPSTKPRRTPIVLPASVTLS